MSIRVERVYDSAEWNDIVVRSMQSTPFHYYEALEVFSDYSGMTLLPYIGYKGDEPVGLFPLFSHRKGPFRLIFSPPPNLKVSYLGPALLTNDTIKQRKVERRHRRFVSAVFDDLSNHFDPQYVHIRSGTAYSDPRPLLWNEFSATPRFTYHVDITADLDELFMSFSSDLRRNVRKAEENLEFTIEEGNITSIREVVRQVAARHEEQGIGFPISPSFIADLYLQLPEGALRVYTCRSGGDFVGGTISIENNDTICSWFSVSNFASDIPAGDLLDWELIKQGKARGLTTFDLIGANSPRLSDYKAKFDPTVRTHYSLERSTLPITIAKSAYLLASNRGRPAVKSRIARVSEPITGLLSR